MWFSHPPLSYFIKYHIAVILNIFFMKGNIIMNKYCVGYIDWFYHELYLEVIYASSERDAMLSHSKLGDFDKSVFSQDIKDLKQELFDSDCMVSAIRID